MKFDINIEDLPSKKELKELFHQTSWASKRQEDDINIMLESLSVFVTVRNKTGLIGFGRAITDGIYRALLDDIIVDKEHQSNGLGRLIVEQLLDQLKDVDEVFLITRPHLEEFYRKSGFNKATTITMKR